MPILGVDLSHHNEPTSIPWAVWRDYYGVRFAIVRLSIGYQQDEIYQMHVDRLTAVGGILHTDYHYLLVRDGEFSYDPARQARVFVSLFRPHWRGPAVVDVEDDNLTEEYLRAFCDEYDKLTGRALAIYTSAAKWHALIGHHVARYAGYFLWAADFKNYPPGLSAPPAGYAADLPDTWASALFEQFSGTGQLGSYKGRVDLDLYRGEFLDLAALWLSIGNDPMDEKLIAIIDAEVAKINAAAGRITSALHPVFTPPPDPAVLFKVKVIIAVLNIRSGPGTTFADVGDASAGEVFNVYEVSAPNGWYRVHPTEARWISGGPAYSVKV